MVSGFKLFPKLKRSRANIERLPAFSFLQLMPLKNGCALISSQHPFLKPIL